MNHDPGIKNKLTKVAESLLFFFLALAVLLISAVIEQAQRLTPTQLNECALLLLLVEMIWLGYRLRGMLR